MATNRDLLKEAIADAKAVKETAIANAKAALEEAFTPYLREKLSAKLAEIEESEITEDDLSEVEKEKNVEMEESMDEISLEELLAELEEGDEEKEKTYEADLNEAEKEEEETEEMSIEDMSEDDLKSFIEDVIKDMVSAGELEAGESMEGGEEEEMEMEAGEEEGTEEELDEEVNLDEILSEDEMEEEELDEEVSLEELLAELEEGEKEEVKEEEEMDEAKDMKKDLEEAYATIETLKSELQEINLFNAKLLYTNKIFRNKSLTESQKVKVLAAFDKATSKKEAQLVYETLLENFKTTTTKSPIKESLGSASKVLGGTTSKPIIENDAFARMRELAGIKK